MSDVIKLDNHRLLCGDATSKEDVDNLLDGAKVDLLLTDPPYGIDIVNTVKGEREREQWDSRNTCETWIQGKVGKPRHCRTKTL